MAKTIVVKQIGSPIRRPAKQRATLIGLGLNKMHKTRELEDTPSVRGMVNKLPHLVEIIEETKDFMEVYSPPRVFFAATRLNLKTHMSLSFDLEKKIYRKLRTRRLQTSLDKKIINYYCTFCCKCNFRLTSISFSTKISHSITIVIIVEL